MPINILTVPISFGIFKPISGGQNRFYNILNCFKNIGFNVVILQSDQYCTTDDSDFAKIYSYHDYRFFNRGIFTFFKDFDIFFLKKLILILKTENIDIIQYTHPTGGIILTKLLIIALRKRILLVYDAQNVESDFINENFKKNLNYSKIERIIIPNYISFIEFLITKYFVDYITTVSEKDKEIFVRKYHIRDNISIIPSGCTVRNFQNNVDKMVNKIKLGLDPNKITIIFHGYYQYPPNKEAFDLIKDVIAPRFKKFNVQFIVGGQGSPKFTQKNFISLGFIQDLSTLLNAADIAIVPLSRGAGTKLKFLDYLGSGLSIVSTKKGAEGIGVTNNYDAIIVDDVNESFIDAIEILINNENQRKIMGQNARQLAIDEYSWDKVKNDLDRIYKILVS